MVKYRVALLIGGLICIVLLGIHLPGAALVAAVGAIGIIAGIAAFWSFIPSERRVEQAAERYALALLDAARVLAHGS